VPEAERPPGAFSRPGAFQRIGQRIGPGIGRRLARACRRVALVAVGLTVVAAAAGAVYEEWSRRRAWRLYPPPGELVRVDGRSFHLHCLGQGSPTVILEAGLDRRGSLAWSTVQPEMAALTRVCAYDRAGIQWSEAGQEPRDAERIASDLHALLEAAEVAPPYVLVGHSLGGPLSRVYAHRFPDEVMGFVWVDSSHPEQLQRLPREVIAARPEPRSRIAPRISRAIGWTRLRGPRARDAGSAFAPTSVRGVVGEQRALEDVFAQAGGTGPFGGRPLVVLTAGTRPRPPERSEELHARLQEGWLALQVDLATLSINSDHRVIAQASHYIQVDDPEAVVTAVEEVVAAVRDGGWVRRAAEDPGGGRW